MKKTTFAVVLLAAASCAKPCPPESNKPAATPAPPLASPAPDLEGKALMDADRAFEKATAERGIDGWVSFFAPEGAQLFRDGTWVTGAESIRKEMGPFLAKAKLTWVPLSAAIDRGGRIGYTFGRSHLVLGEKESDGSYVTVWRKQADGSWKVVFDTGDPDQLP